MSSVAEKVKLFSVSPLLKVTLAGYAGVGLQSAAPSWLEAVIGTTTWRLGSALRLTLTVTLSPSATV